MIGETKSEIYSPNSPKIIQSEEYKARECTKTQVYKSFLKSPNKYSNVKYLSTGYQGGAFNGVKNMS